MAQFENLQQEPKLDGFAKRFKSYFLDVRDKKNFARRRALYKQFWIKLADKSQSKFIAKTQQSVLHEFAGRVIAWLTKLSAYVWESLSVPSRLIAHSFTHSCIEWHNDRCDIRPRWQRWTFAAASWRCTPRTSSK